MALPTRFVTARAIRSGSPRTTVGVRPVGLHADAAARGVRSRSTTAVTTSSRRTSSCCSAGLEPRASSTTSPTRLVSSSSSPTMSALHLLALGRRQPVGVAEHLDVRPQAGDRRAQLVAGVGHQVALGLGRALQRVQGGVVAARQPGQLVVADHLHPLAQVGVLAQALGARGEAADRHQRGARHHGAERRRRARCPRRPTTISATRIRFSCESTSSSDRATCTAPPPGCGLVSTRTWVPSTVASVSVGSPPSRASVARLGADTGSAASERPGGRTTLAVRR